MRRQPRQFAATWPSRSAPPVPDLDLRRPGLVDPATRRAVLRGALAGPPARPGVRRRRSRDGPAAP
ncbi:MAG TPA: hypothetical protein VKV21_05305 [Solirubrobacteraceae bacterium]|nr:hypothetical protein [Solirubrobacteraceae bacterium]